MATMEFVPSEIPGCDNSKAVPSVIYVPGLDGGVEPQGDAGSDSGHEP
jgi:hypothetical protein